MRPPALEHLAHEMTQHLLGHLEIGDHPVAQGAGRRDLRRCRRISKESRQAARRQPAPAGAKGWLFVSMCQIALP
jgi:hypothetical protein